MSENKQILALTLVIILFWAMGYKTKSRKPKHRQKFTRLIRKQKKTSHLN